MYASALNYTRLMYASALSYTQLMYVSTHTHALAYVHIAIIVGADFYVGYINCMLINKSANV